MSQKIIYTITLINFNKHNPTLKRGHKSTLISNKFFEDAKVMMLPTTTQLLLIKLILTCGEHCSNTVALSKQQLNNMLAACKQVESSLSALQQLQVLTWEKSEPFKIRRDKIRREEKGIERNVKELRASDKSAPPLGLKYLIQEDKPIVVLREKQFHSMISLWNKTVVSLSKVERSNGSRDQKIKVIWGELSSDEWVDVFSRIDKSDFCLGKNDRGWKATFDFILKKDSYLKVLEGKYDNKINQGFTESGGKFRLV